MREHITILAWIHILWSGLHLLLAALLLLGALGLGSAAALTGGLLALPIFAAIGGAVAFVLAVVYLPGLLMGIGLLNGAGWARILGVILSLINLVHFPIGTVVGLYGLWVLLRADSAGILDR